MKLLLSLFLAALLLATDAAIVAIWTGTSEVLLYDVNGSDYPPPVVIVDGVVVDRSN